MSVLPLRRIASFLSVCVALLLLAPASHAEVFEVHVPNPVPGPRASATPGKTPPMVWRFTQSTKNGLETKTVTIKDLPRRLPGETNDQAIARKVKTLVDAVNAELGAGRAEATMYKNSAGKMVPGFTVYGLASGTDKGKAVVPSVLVSDPTLQAGNGGRVIRGSGGKLSLGGVLGISDSVDLAAIGFDEDGQSSIVEFGIDGRYVARLAPSPGATDLSVLAMLSADLASNGVPNTFDSVSRSLTIEPLYDADIFGVYWTSTDPGLLFSGGVFAVPEPHTWALMVAGITLIGSLQRRRLSARSINVRTDSMEPA